VPGIIVLALAMIALGFLRSNPALLQSLRDRFSSASAPVEPQLTPANSKPADHGVKAAELELMNRKMAEAKAAEERATAVAEQMRVAREKQAAETKARKEVEARLLAEKQAAEQAAQAEPEKAPQTSADASADEAPEGLAIRSSATHGGFVHPGLLHNEEDLKRMKAKKAFKPWKEGWEKMVNGRHADLKWTPHPAAVVVRGGTGENYADFYRDIATSYVCAICWRVTGKRDYAEKSIEILNAWSSTLKELGGTYDKYLAAGIYGYEIANAAEIMRTYEGWKPEDFKRFQKMMLTIFLPMNKHFVDTHGDSPGKIDHFWPNWELCNLASMISIGVLCDDRTAYNEAVRYMKRGEGPGAIKVVVYYTAAHQDL
jgi:Alginate lyase